MVSAGESLEDHGFDASGFAQAVPGQGSFFVMMTMLAGAALLVQERDNRTLQRQMRMPVRRLELLGGNITGRFAMGVIQFGIVFIAGAVFGMSYEGIVLPIILVLLAFVLCITALTFFLGDGLQYPFGTTSTGFANACRYKPCRLGRGVVPLAGAYASYRAYLACGMGNGWLS